MNSVHWSPPSKSKKMFCLPASSVCSMDPARLHYSGSFHTGCKRADNLPRVKQLVWGRAGGLSRSDLLVMRCSMHILSANEHTPLKPQPNQKQLSKLGGTVLPRPSPPHPLSCPTACFFLLTAKHFGSSSLELPQVCPGKHTSPPPKITAGCALLDDTNSAISQTNGPSVGPPGSQAGPSPSSA